MTVSAAAARARAAAERPMIHPATVTRPSGPPTLDDETGVLAPAEPDEVYEGPCRLGPASGDDRSREDTTLSVGDHAAVVPIDAGPFEIGDTVTIDGRSFRVARVVHRTWGYDQLLDLEEVTDRG